MPKRIHFHSSDARFCGCKDQARQFTLDPNEITCEACADHDTFTLSPDAEKYVRELEAKSAKRAQC